MSLCILSHQHFYVNNAGFNFKTFRNVAPQGTIRFRKFAVFKIPFLKSKLLCYPTLAKYLFFQRMLAFMKCTGFTILEHLFAQRKHEECVKRSSQSCANVEVLLWRICLVSVCYSCPLSA